MNSEQKFKNPAAFLPAASHLSHDALDEVLMGIGSLDAVAHLRVCEICGQRVANFESQMALFNQASLAWSDARSNTLSRDLAAHKPTPRLTIPALCYSAAAVVLAVAVGLSASMHRAATLEADNSSTLQIAAASGVDQHEIASDNQMLAAIDSEIVTPRPAQFGLYDEVQTHIQPEHRTLTRQVKD